MPDQPASSTRPFQIQHRNLPALYEYLRRRIGLGGLLLTLSIGTITGWPNGPWVPFAVGIPFLHATYLHRTGRQPGGMTLVIDGAGVAVATLTMGIPTVTAAALCFYVVVASVLTSGRRALAVAVYAAAWIGVSALWSYEGFKDPYDPEAKVIIEVSSSIFFALAIALIVAAVMVQLRRTDRARSGAVDALVDSNAQLEELIRSKDRFVASVSHELRTPLTAVMGLAEELSSPQSEFSGGDLTEFHRLIAGEAGEVARIVEDLLVAARADIGQVAVFPQEIPLRRFCTETVSSVAELGHVDHVAHGDPIAYADPIRVKQIIRNLLVNAARYGGDRVRIVVTSDSNKSIVEVADDGSGIPQEAISRIFEPYGSAHEPGTQVKSIGLGLAVSRTLARIMDGDLSYDRRGEWTVFSLSLPSEGGRD